MGAVFVDLDRTLLRRASGKVLHAALVAEGVARADSSLPGDGLLYALYDRFGENVFAMALARAAALAARGWSQLPKIPTLATDKRFRLSRALPKSKSMSRPASITSPIFSHARTPAR